MLVGASKVPFSGEVRAPIIGTATIVVVVVRATELVHADLGVELNAARPRSPERSGSRGCGRLGRGRGGAGALPHLATAVAGRGRGRVQRRPPQARLANLDELTRRCRLVNLSGPAVIGIAGLRDKGRRDRGEVREGRSLGRLHGPVAEDASLGRGGLDAGTRKSRRLKRGRVGRGGRGHIGGASTAVARRQEYM